jgi:dipeptidase
MCDTLVVVESDGVWLAKNSDREPGEAQVVEHRARARHDPGARLTTTYLTIDQAPVTHETVISRPAWMWGAEMGVNEHGLAVGNEAVFTRVPVDATGLTGMDLVRLALERCRSAAEALDLVTSSIAEHGQGGACGYRRKRFRYHNAFLFADPAEAWLLETAGRFWAAARLRRGTVRTTSNVLTIGTEHDRLGPGTVEAARALGTLRPGETLDFRKAFADPVMGYLSGGDVRRACTAQRLSTASTGETETRRVDLAAVLDALRDHAGLDPSHGLRMTAPCAHASWLPTRHAGQTTGSMVVRLSGSGGVPYFTGTSAPCLSVFKPVPLGRGPIDTGPAPRADGADDASLFWRAEALHRAVLRDFEPRRRTFAGERARLEERALAQVTPEASAEAWREHRAIVGEWLAKARSLRPTRQAGIFDAYWALQSRRDGMPG